MIFNVIFGITFLILLTSQFFNFIFSMITGKFGAVLASVPLPLMAALYCVLFAYIGKLFSIVKSSMFCDQSCSEKLESKCKK